MTKVEIIRLSPNINIISYLTDMFTFISLACVFNGTLHRTDHFGDAAAGIGDLNNRRGIDLQLATRPATAATLTMGAVWIQLKKEPKHAQSAKAAVCYASRGSVIASKSVTPACSSCHW